jgi:integrase
LNSDPGPEPDLAPYGNFRHDLATNLHEMGVPTKVIQRVCRHADEATTKKHYIHAAEPGVRSGMRKLEASITREKNEKR